MKRINPRLQHMLPPVQHYHRNLTNCDSLPKPTLRWMCPRCDRLHVTTKTFLAYFQCQRWSCGWEGTLNDLKLGNIMPNNQQHQANYVGAIKIDAHG